MLQWIFGPCKTSVREQVGIDHASGTLHLQRATVNWKLSINAEHLPLSAKIAGKRTFRSLKIGGNEVEFSEGFTDLHTKCYEHILQGKGFGIEDARPSLEIVHELRQQRNS